MREPYNSRDLKKFGAIADWEPDLGRKFFDYYGAVFEEGALTSREKSLIALAVSHAIRCPDLTRSFMEDSFDTGADESQIMEAIHIAASVASGASLAQAADSMKKVGG